MNKQDKPGFSKTYGIVISYVGTHSGMTFFCVVHGSCVVETSQATPHDDTINHSTGQGIACLGVSKCTFFSFYSKLQARLPGYSLVLVGGSYSYRPGKIKDKKNTTTNVVAMVTKPSVFVAVAVGLPGLPNKIYVFRLSSRQVILCISWTYTP